MANITLQTLITESADYVKADLEDDDDAPIIEARLTSALNEAKNLIAQKLRLATSEEVTLDADSCFDSEALTQTFWRLKGVKDARASEATGTLIKVEAAANSKVTVEYEYIPVDMENEADEYPLPGSVSWRILCLYAAARFYQIKGTQTSLNKYHYWIGEWNTALTAVSGNKMSRRRIKAVYNFGGFQ